VSKWPGFCPGYEIKRKINGISQRMLTLSLRDLEREGLVTRTIYSTIPPQVDYKLTVLGRSLWQVVHPLGVWARIHRLEMTKAREAFDLAKHEGPDVHIS
jgi:DNA-binding HxlR family transcriptional regulator